MKEVRGLLVPTTPRLGHRAGSPQGADCDGTACTAVRPGRREERGNRLTHEAPSLCRAARSEGDVPIVPKTHKAYQEDVAVLRRFISHYTSAG